MTTMEKFATNYVMTNIARIAMIVTPVLLSWFMTMANAAWERQDARISKIELEQQGQKEQLQDLNFRAQAGKTAREALTLETKSQFTIVSTKLDALNSAVIRLQTIIESRLVPPHVAQPGLKE